MAAEHLQEEKSRCMEISSLRAVTGGRIAITAHYCSVNTSNLPLKIPHIYLAEKKSLFT